MYLWGRAERGRQLDADAGTPATHTKIKNKIKQRQRGRQLDADAGTPATHEKIKNK
jgi:hypothetical protein